MWKLLRVKYYCYILTRLEFSWHIFEESSNIKISSKCVQWKPSCSMRTNGRTNGHNEAFSNFENAPKMELNKQENVPLKEIDENVTR
jgi:hypothetical protein